MLYIIAKFALPVQFCISMDIFVVIVSQHGVAQIDKLFT